LWLSEETSASGTPNAESEDGTMQIWSTEMTSSLGAVHPWNAARHRGGGDFRPGSDTKVRRVAIDALGDLERCSIDTQRFANFMYALIQWFAVENATCMMTCQVGLSKPGES